MVAASAFGVLAFGLTMRQYSLTARDQQTATEMQRRHQAGAVHLRILRDTGMEGAYAAGPGEIAPQQYWIEVVDATAPSRRFIGLEVTWFCWNQVAAFQAAIRRSKRSLRDVPAHGFRWISFFAKNFMSEQTRRVMRVQIADEYLFAEKNLGPAFTDADGQRWTWRFDGPCSRIASVSAREAADPPPTSDARDRVSRGWGSRSEPTSELGRGSGS